MTPLNRISGLPSRAVQSRADVTGRGKRASHGFDVGLMGIADYGVQSQPCSTQCAAEEGYGTGAVPFVP